MKFCYIERKFSPSSQETVDQANSIIREYQAAGFVLTLRQLYYQFVARGLIPNKIQEYKRIGSIINDARLAGLIDWKAVEDRTRNLNRPSTWGSPADILDSAADSYKRDLWKTQDTYCEVWIEKDALVGVLEDACQELRVPFFACRGYSSQSEQWAAGMRFANKINEGKSVVVFHLGDHDPSGIDMTRDNEERLRMFIEAHAEGSFRFERLALNMDQVEEYAPPPNPAKITDSRFESYEAAFGTTSWELDALEPRVIKTLVEKHVGDVINADAWDEAKDKEDEEIGWLHDLAEQKRDETTE